MYDDLVEDNINRMCVKCDKEVVLSVADCAEISGKCFLHELENEFYIKPVPEFELDRCLPMCDYFILH